MRPIVLLHGWAMDGRVFHDARMRLGSRFDCHAPDLPGHGLCPHPAPDIDTAADALHRLLDEAGLRGAVVVGWSMGATVAWRCLARHGAARIGGLVSVDMSPRLVNDSGWRLGLRGLDAAGSRRQADWFRHDWRGATALIAAGMYADPLRTCPLVPSATVRERLLSCDATAMAHLWLSLCEADERAGIARLAVPMLVLHGRHSGLYRPGVAHWLEETAPHARRQEFALSGHSPHLEEPAAFAEAVAGFADAI
ncbi:MAG: alpha/beta fold hydrolase [Gemmobacter sp.]